MGGTTFETSWDGKYRKSDFRSQERKSRLGFAIKGEREEKLRNTTAPEILWFQCLCKAIILLF
jgi:hypothetical protein